MAGYPDIYDDIYEGDAGALLVLGGLLFQSTPTFSTGAIAGPLGGVLFQSTPVFPTGTVSSSVTLAGNLFQSTPTFPTGLFTLPLAGNLFQKAPTFPTGVVTGGNPLITGNLFQHVSTFPVGALIADLQLAGVLFVSTPNFLQGTISTPGGARMPFKVEITDRSYRVRVTFP